MFLHTQTILILNSAYCNEKNKVLYIFSYGPLLPYTMTMSVVGTGQDVVGGLEGTVDSSGHTGETPAIRLHYLPALYTL